MSLSIIYKQFWAKAVALTLLGVPAMSGNLAISTAEADKKEATPAADVNGTTLNDQVDLALTIYNSNIALVRDVRQLQMPSGVFDLRFMDIAATVNPATVSFRSLSEPGRVGVLEQNYQFDLLDPNKLLQKYVGREITLIRARQDSGTTKYDEVKATLLAFNNGPVWKIGNEIVTGMYADHYRFPELPENLHSRPTLVWMLENRGAPRQKVEASYLAGNMQWNADYVLTVSRDDKLSDLNGWVTVTNTSGTTYKNSRLQLVAGDLNRIQQGYARNEVAMKARAMEMAASADQFKQESFSEYHLYSLGRRTTIANNETKQISLLTGSSVPIEKLFVVDGQNFYYHNQHSPGSPIKDKVKVFYKFKNDEKSGLGIPMPMGNVRVYQQDSKGGVQFVGEDRINHTPKNEVLTLQIGTAFDVVCERKQTDYKHIGGRTYEMEFEITLRNHKESAIVVDVNEPIGGDWTMIESTHKHTKSAAWAANFKVPVEKDGTAVLKYRIRARW